MTAVTAARATVPCPLCLALVQVALEPGMRQATCTACGRPLLLDRPLPVSDEAFASVRAGAEVPVLVDFHAGWCAPCRMTAPLLDEVALDLAGRALVCKVDIDEHPGAALELGVRSIPTLVAFRDGREVDREVGMPTPSRLRAMLDPRPD
jgi:thioredoxin 2